MKNYRIILSALAVAVVLLLGGSFYWQNKDFKTYKDKYGSFTLKVLKTWRVNEMPAPGIEAMFFAPVRPGIFASNIGVSMKPMQGITEIDEKMRGEIKKEISDSFKGFKISSDGMVEGLAYEAYQITGNYTYQKLHVKVKQIFFAGEGNLYVLTFTSGKDSFDKYSDEFTRVAKSFRIKK